MTGFYSSRPIFPLSPVPSPGAQFPELEVRHEAVSTSVDIVRLLGRRKLHDSAADERCGCGKFGLEGLGMPGIGPVFGGAGRGLQGLRHEMLRRRLFRGLAHAGHGRLGPEQRQGPILQRPWSLGERGAGRTSGMPRRWGRQDG